MNLLNYYFKIFNLRIRNILIIKINKDLNMNKREPASELPPNYMKVTSKRSPIIFIEYGIHILTETKFPELVVMGSG